MRDLVLRLGRLPAPLRRGRARPYVTVLSRALTGVDQRLARAGRSTIGGRIAGAPVLLLMTTGRRSGKAHVTPVLFHQEALDSVLLVAANGAADWHPDWYHNLLANPTVQLGVDRQRQQGTATVLEGSQRAAV